MSNEVTFEIKSLTFNDELWEQVSQYARNCSWGVGEVLSNQMNNHVFSDWERVFVALVDNQIAGYCTLQKTDCIPNVPYTPYVSAVFVGEPFRGNRISEKLCLYAICYAKSLGFDRVHLVSNHVNLYEKYGFVKIDAKPAPWNPSDIETIFMHLT